MTVFRRGKRYSFDLTVRGHRIAKGGFPTKELARLAQEAERRRGLDTWAEQTYGVRAPRPRTATLRQFLEGEYLPSLGRLAKHTQATARSACKVLLEAMGDVHLVALAPRHFDAFVAGRRAAGVSVNGVRDTFRWLARLCAEAVRRGYLERSPVRGYLLPRAEPVRARAITSPELRRLLRGCRRPGLRAIVWLGAWTALRPQELCRLEWCHVELTNRRLRIPQPKVGREKVVPLLPQAVTTLRRMWRAAGHVFLNDRTGKPWTVLAYWQAWTEAAQQAKLTGHTPYSLRHGLATALANDGASVATVGQLLGHLPPYRATLRYFHSDEATLRRHLERVASQQDSGILLEKIRRIK